VLAGPAYPADVDGRAKLLGFGISGGIYCATCCGWPLVLGDRPGSHQNQLYGVFLYCTPLLFLWLGSVLAKRFDSRGGKHRKAD
jgi:hypothetical protein